MLRVMALALSVVLVGALAPIQAQPGDNDWQKVDSKEGGFTIEFPGKPTINKSRTLKGVGGDVKFTIIGCGGVGGIYMAYKVEEPTAVVKGTEDTELDAKRDFFAKEFNGKVLAERKIRGQKTVGRDFTIRGVPEPGEGTVTIRMRAYLSGNSVYVVSVMSLPNRELPEDTGRFLGSLMIGGTRAEGTTLPDQNGTNLPGWGLAIDPQKDCEFTPAKDKLTMAIKSSKHQMAAERQNLNSPRVMREVEGDFTVTVKVNGDFRPGGRSTNSKSAPWHGAGIIVWSDADNYIRLERSAVNRNGKIFPYVNFEEFEGGAHGVTNNETMKGGDCWLRMERKGSRIHGSISFDGTTWKDLKPIQIVWPTKLKIGLQATTTSSLLPWTVTFENYELKTKNRKVE